MFTESLWLLHHWIVMTVHFTESSWLLFHWIIMTVSSLNHHDYSLNHHDCYFTKSSWLFTSLNCHECYCTESPWLFKLDLVYTSLCEINQVWTRMHAHFSLFDGFISVLLFLFKGPPWNSCIFRTSWWYNLLDLNCKIIWHKYWQSF